jgi:hypothetical protein
MRRLTLSLALATTLLMGLAGSALGHVHGITPLRCVGSPMAGAERTETTPAWGPSGPLRGLIPRDVGSAPLTGGDGGFDTPACPA